MQNQPSTRLYEVLEGFVQTANDSGFKILERWVNYGNRYDGRHATPGEQVKVRINQGKFVVHLVGIADELPPEPAPRRQGGGGAYRSPEEERRSVRQAALNAAVEWLSTFGAESGDLDRKPTSSDVLKLAERFEQWIYR